ncbi:MAG TPA: DUF4214 domain-containing protein [Hyphomicrobiales bacterium]|nr:DUF4214 domain-containing protein [Hyphomicrobiales bacterium]
MVWRFLLIFLVGLSAGGGRVDAKSAFKWGVNGHPFTAYPGIGIDEQIGLIHRLGLTSYRVNISSLDDAPKLRELIGQAKQYDIDILPVLTPPLNLEKLDAGALYRKARAFAVYFASRFKDDIRIWELGNELENFAIIQPCEMQDNGVQYNCEWGPGSGVGPLEYYGARWSKVSAVLKGLSDGTVSVDPKLLKAMGTAGWGHVGAFHRMREDGIKWDISVWHYYGNDLEWGLERLQQFGKPVWLTEFNHPQGSQKSEDEQAAGLAKIMRQIEAHREKYRIEAAHIYELLDESYWAPDFEAYMGLVRLEKRQGRWAISGKKPAFCTVRDRLLQNAPLDQDECGRQAAVAKTSLIESQLQYGYDLALQRRPDSGGLNSWTRSVLAGKPVPDVTAELFNSDEAAKHYGTSGLSDDDFVRLVYRRLLDRQPDQDGREAYLAKLINGEMSRSDIVEAVVASREFAEKHPILFTRQAGH